MEAIIGPIVEIFVAPIGKQLGYLTFYEKNVKKLMIEVTELNRIRDGLKPRIEAAHKNGYIIDEEVHNWQIEVDKTKVKAETFKSRCWRLSRYSLSRKATKMTQDVVIELRQKGEKLISGIIAHPRPPGWPQPYPPTEPGESNEISLIVNDVLETFKDDKMYLIGIHGINRDDIKRLVNTIFMKTKNGNQFQDSTIAIRPSNEGKIQDDIAYWLGLTFNSNSEVARRNGLYGRLVDHRKKLIVLDDVCEIPDLDAIGIPLRQGEWNKTCKIIVTSSEKSICEKMNTQKKYKLVVHQQMFLFGDDGTGDFWDDKAHTTIRAIILAYSNKTGICSFQTEYDDNGHWSRSSNHEFLRNSKHDKEEKIDLGHPDEFLISVSGYYKSETNNHVVLRSLTFKSNKKTFGPFGPETEAGDQFFTSSTKGRVIGFFGRNSDDSLGAFGYYYEEAISIPAGPEQPPISIPAGPDQPISDFGGSDGSSDIYVDRLGAYTEPFPAQNEITVFDQEGGKGGSPWDDGAAHTTVRQIILKVGHEKVITHLHVEYDNNGSSECFAHGVESFHTKSVIKLDYPGEFLISMSGTTREIYGWRVVSSLIFQSNRRTYGPYGDESGDPFSTSPSHSGKIVGFHGKSGAHLDSIGAYFEASVNS